MEHSQNRKGEPKGSDKKPLRVAWFSPLRLSQDAFESPSPSAYVSSVLLPLIKERCELELFHDSFDSLEGYPTFHYLTAWDRHRNNPFDVFFYHLEDHRRTAFARMHLALKPGLVWFHDLLLTDDGPEPILNSAWERVVQKFQKAGTPWPERGEEFKRPRPHAVREVGIGGIPIFSSEKDLKEYHLLAARMGKEKGLAFEHPYSEVISTPSHDPLGFLLPYPVLGPKLESSKRATGNEFVLGLCVPPGIEGRVPAILEALRRVSSGPRLASTKKCRLHWLLDNAKEREIAESMLKDFGVQDLCTTSGGPDGLPFGRGPYAWENALDGIDVALHLHFSVYGQPGPALALSLAKGLPTLVSDFGGSDFLPDDVVLKIRPGAGEVQEIAAVIDGLRTGRLVVDARRAQSVATERHDARQIADQLLCAMRLSGPALERIQTRWNALEGEAAQALIREVAPPAQSWFDNERDLVLRAPFKEFGWGRL